jgi:hypothetical protein
MSHDKVEMLRNGVHLMEMFCAVNTIGIPKVIEADPERWPFGTCAYYRNNVTTICVRRCASIGTAGMQWSYPGNTVDRTPYGVIQHELGHHVDMTKSSRTDRYRGDFSLSMRAESGEKPITTYCPDDGEWFAEMFRLFVTNPDLLRILRPRTHAAMLVHFTPVFGDTWRARMTGAPERTIKATERKVEAVAA